MRGNFPGHLRRWPGELYRERAVSSDRAVGCLSWQIFKMRVLLAIAVLAFSNVGVIAASSTDDLCVVASNYRRALPPLNHYFPTTGMKPKVGRAEDLSAVRGAPEPQKTYRQNY
jgi:hypothetical protein